MTAEISLFDILEWKHEFEDVRRQIRLGADVNEIDNITGYTPIHLVVAHAHPDMEILKYLVDSNADVNGSPLLLSTPLHEACYSNHDDKAIRFLIDNGCRLNQQDHIGRTALHWAVMNNYTLPANYLVEIGADMKILDEEGNTAFELAKRYGFMSIKTMEAMMKGSINEKK